MSRIVAIEIQISGQIGFGGKFQIAHSGLALTASLIVEGTNPGDWKFDKNKLSVGLEFG